MQIFKTRTFKWWEIVLVKVCLISFGIILTLYFYDFFMSLLWLWWPLFAVTAMYFVARFMKGE